MNSQELEEEKNRLIEKLGVHMEKENNLAPLAARILATMIIIGKQGITFDQLVKDLGASKSTISNHLDHLQASNKIKYYTKPGDRKRYFIINSDLMMNIIDGMLSKWESEKQIHLNILDYKGKVNALQEEGDEIPYDLEFQKDYLIFLQEATAAIQKLKTNIISKKHITNHNSKK